MSLINWCGKVIAENESLKSEAFSTESDRPKDPPITKFIWLLPLTLRSFIFLARLSEDKFLPSIARAIVYEFGLIFERIASPSVFFII